MVNHRALWILAAIIVYIPALFIVCLYIPYISLQQTGGVRAEDNLIPMMLLLCAGLAAISSLCLFIAIRHVRDRKRYARFSCFLIVASPIIVPLLILFWLFV